MRRRSSPQARRERPGRPEPARIVVDLVDKQRRVRVGKTWLSRLVRRALLAEGIDEAEVAVLLADDRRIASLHGEWLDDATPTDVITFDLSDPPGLPGGDGVLRGDIVVSTETAVRMAAEVGWTARFETAYYVLHGILHLAGYDDLSPGPRRAMRRRERTLLESLGLPAPPRPRASGRTRR